MAVYLQSLTKVSQGCNTISKACHWGMGYQHIYWSTIPSTTCLEERDRERGRELSQIDDDLLWEGKCPNCLTCPLPSTFHSPSPSTGLPRFLTFSLCQRGAMLLCSCQEQPKPSCLTASPLPSRTVMVMHWLRWLSHMLAWILSCFSPFLTLAYNQHGSDRKFLQNGEKKTSETTLLYSKHSQMSVCLDSS